MKSLTNVAFEALECLSTQELATAIDFIELLINLYAIGGKPRTYNADRAVSLSVAAMEARTDPQAPYELDAMIERVKADLSCFSSCQWEDFQNSHEADAEADRIMAEWSKPDEELEKAA